MDKVLVTGGGGFIGKALVRALVDHGLRVAVVGRNSYPELASLGVECLRGDIRDTDFLVRACAGFDTVFHVAAKAGVWGPRAEYFAINLHGTENVLAACQANGVERLVYTSTPSVVFDGRSLEGADERAPYARRPLCAYAASKTAAERVVLSANGGRLRTIAIRPHLVWGPGDHHLIPRLLERGRSGTLKVVGNGTNRVDITYIDNVVQAHLLAAKNLAGTASGAGQAFFIGQEEPVNLWQWINALFARLAVPQVQRRVPFGVAWCVGLALEAIHTALQLDREPRMTRFVAHQLARSHWFSHAKAENLLGYQPAVSTGQGVERLLASLSRESSALRGSAL
ncbi:MAG: NAD-dependent epimerase/dehydratase family protein [Desulfobulbus sp.]|jgi:nucleoside-diphosphate-sugar epimerase|nr:NAD-dependent epimerase/dehydratase family protein [Desulfobulbus sp.]